MTIKLSVARTQWAVGNGFFHSGCVSTTASSISYVYDCGALGANHGSLLREVDEHASRTDRVHFMFVSHFDFDHVSGIPHLIQRVCVDRFIIPFVSSSERLFIFAGNVADGSLGDGSPDATDFYEEFIIDPTAALSALAADVAAPIEVQLVGPAEAALSSTDITQVAELLSRDAVKGSVEDATLRVEFETTRVTANADSDPVWEWLPYVASRALGAIPQFVNALIEFELIDEASDLQNPSRIANLVKTHRQDLARAYEIAIKTVGASFNRNLTSLMLYSGPALGSQHRAYRTRTRPRTGPVERAEIGAWNPRPGWLGLGDADLRSKQRVHEVNTRFHNYKPLVGTFAPSHHGSREDWDPSLMTGFDPDSAHPPTYVFGASGRYGHPHDDVLLSINEAGGTSVTVGLRETSRWTESLRVFIRP